MRQARGYDEHLDQAGRLRGAWRRLLGPMLGMGTAVLRERAAELERACADEGTAALLPGARGRAWQCDPIPFLLTETEFGELAAGLAQRADLLERILADIYGPRDLLAQGHLKPSLVFPSPAYLRACRTSLDQTLDGAQAGRRHLQLYAADLVRGPTGRWCVVADRTGEPAGLGTALENRRVIARVLPELFRSVEVAELRPFFDTWQDSIQRLVPTAGGNPGLALLTQGHGAPGWPEDVVLARALGCALLEDGDLTVRGGSLWVKTLRGLRPVHVLLRRQPGSAIDPLELPGDTSSGTPGLLTAMRRGALQVLNGPGAAYAEAPGLAAMLPHLARVLTGRDLALDAMPSLWLGDEDARDRVGSALEDWQIVSAFDPGGEALVPAALDADGQAALRARIAARPWAFTAIAPPEPSLAPCSATGETLVSRPVALRLFLVFDGNSWRPLQGGFAQVIGDTGALFTRLTQASLCKDVWVLLEEGMDIHGPGNLTVPPLPIRRTQGDLPSRVADNFYWFGRYLERLENAARLIRAMLVRLARGHLLPRDMPEMAALIACLAEAGIVDRELATGAGTGQLADLLLRALARDTGIVARLTGRVRDLADLLRDRLSGEMHAMIAHDLRRLKGNRLLLRPNLGAGGPHAVGIGLMSDFAGQVLQFCASVAGYAAENMVRGGGRLFLDLGRRIERAQEVARQLSQALDQKPERIETGLLLALELCDSALTYRSRYLTAVQPATVIDLVVADEGNPRGLRFQLVAARDTLESLASPGEARLTAPLETAIAETSRIVAELVAADNQAEIAAALAPRLRAIETEVAALSDALVRRYFTLLPITFTDGMQ
jgi:uncharacterized circularly permuted ATP-grasp superfamily protein/uncharacterized alpha-E superfamily protein